MPEVIADLMEYKRKLLEYLDEFKELQDTNAKKTISFSINNLFSELTIMGSTTDEYVFIMYIQLKRDIYNTLLTTKLTDVQKQTITDNIMINIASVLTLSSEGKALNYKKETTTTNVLENLKDMWGRN